MRRAPLLPADGRRDGRVRHDRHVPSGERHVAAPDARERLSGSEGDVDAVNVASVAAANKARWAKARASATARRTREVAEAVMTLRRETAAESAKAAAEAGKRNAAACE